MSTPNNVLIAGERHLIILGQFGNMQSKINSLEHILKAAHLEDIVPFIKEIQDELDYLIKVYPQLDGGLEAADAIPVKIVTDPAAPEIDQALRYRRLSNNLRDMRTLIDAAYLSYTHEGAIECHLKTMFDIAWRRAADECGIDDVDAIPV